MNNRKYESYALALKRAYNNKQGPKTPAKELFIIKQLLELFPRMYYYKYIHIPGKVVSRSERLYQEKIYSSYEEEYESKQGVVKLTPCEYDVLQFLKSDDNIIKITEIECPIIITD